MSPTTHLVLRRIALGVAIAAIAAILVPVAPAAVSIELGTGEIPYLVSDQQSIKLGPGEIPYVDYGTPAPTAVQGAADDGSEIGFGVGSSAVMLLLLLTAGGALVAIRHSRKTKLSPA